MPELPEVETVVRGLAPFLEGAQIKALETSDKRLRFEYPDNFRQALIGASFVNIRRRAKYIIGELNNDFAAIIHLGMSGRISLVGNGQTIGFDEYEYSTGELSKHDHVKLHLIAKDKSEFSLIYNDPRRFGLWDIALKDEIENTRHFSHLGPEPLESNFDEKVLMARIGKKAAPIKLSLLNQEIVVGLGNIYVCEALFMSHINPERPANSLSAKEAKLLVQNCKLVLNNAINAGGSTLKDFAHADGSLGEFQDRFLVYDREKAACQTPKCKGQIARIPQGGRSTFYCPSCQK